MRTIPTFTLAAAFFSALLAGCTSSSTNIANRPVTDAFDPARSYTFDNWIDSRSEIPNGDLIILSFSGGGSRAAALSAAVLEELHRLGLSDSIAIISSTSGGSVTAGYYALTGSDGLAHLNHSFLAKNNTAALARDIVPGLFAKANRSELFADYLDQGPLKQAFPDHPASYADLMKRWPQAPFVVMNATDASTGSTVELTQEYFSHLCSDLGSFRVSTAVAASASFPFLFTPIPLRNYWDQPACAKVIDSFDPLYKNAFDNRYLNLEAFVKARHVDSLRNTYRQGGESEPEKRPHRTVNYVHLIDGGLSDNLAARSLLRTFSPQILDKLLNRNLKRILLVQVNAKGESQRPIDTSAEAPSIVQILETAVLNPLDVTTALSSYISKNYWVTLINSVSSPASSDNAAVRNAGIVFFPVQVDFDLIENNPTEMEDLKAIGTDWRMKEGKLELINRVGKQLLNRHPCFQAFLKDATSAGVVTGCEKIAVEKLSIRTADTRTFPPPAPVVATPPPSAILVAPVPPPTSEKVTFNAELFFAQASSALHPQGKAALDRMVAKLDGADAEVVIVVGHTDTVGSDGANSLLSLRRAEAVKAYLVASGIEPGLIYTEGRGESQPVVQSDSVKGRAANRRVEVEVVATRKASN